MDVTISVAGFADLSAVTAYRIWQLRMAVFVLEQDCPYQDLDGRDLEPSTRHVWVDGGGGDVAAYLRVLSEPSGEARIGRVCVDSGWRSAGLAAQLMQRAHVEAGGRVCVLNAQAHLAEWYVRLGYDVDGPEFLDDGIPHVPMRRTP